MRIMIDTTNNNEPMKSVTVRVPAKHKYAYSDTKRLLTFAGPFLDSWNLENPGVDSITTDLVFAQKLLKFVCDEYSRLKIEIAGVINNE
jgi:hypothetical protein